VFVFAGALFIASGLAAAFFRESRDREEVGSHAVRSSWREAFELFRTDRNLRLLAWIAALSGSMMTLFPHYQALGRMRLGLGYDSLVPWIIAQNLGVALFSLPAGWVADRVGNRRVLKWLMFGLCTVPPLALWLSMQGGMGSAWFFIVFALLGLTPVSMRTFSNYTLELVDRRRQPHYLAVVSMAMAGPAVLASLAVGVLIDWAGFEIAFWLVTICQITAFYLTFRLIEPRRQGFRNE
ncbi:MAG TPA: MFS transporter, partial [Pirellulaceae bacterium]|nr:MFS transporter [Pirellulaceae bacterium]